MGKPTEKQIEKWLVEHVNDSSGGRLYRLIEKVWAEAQKDV